MTSLQTKEYFSIQRLLIISSFFLLLLAGQCASIEWLALGGRDKSFWNKTADCSKRRTPGLKRQQRAICKRNLEMMPVVGHAAREVVKVCQTLFEDNRWNCSSLILAPNYRADLTGGSREQAYVFALSAGALMQTIAKACAMGVTTKCACGRLPNEPPPADFKWGGCGDDVKFGLIFSQSFADTQWEKRKKRMKKSAMNMHNNRAGRKIVAESLQTACKCHGVSGSCSIKTCWRGLPDVRSIGNTLQKRYAVAVEVANKRGKAKQRRLVPIIKKRKSFQDDELIYYTKSSDYCLPDPSLGSVGTMGRACNKTMQGSGGCQSMCCGRGYDSQVVEMRQRCDCKYYWCCYVKCKTCTKKVEINTCR